VNTRISLLLAVLIAGGAGAGRGEGGRRLGAQWAHLRCTHFSPLRQIDTSNVATLGLAWEFDGFVVRGRTHRGNEPRRWSPTASCISPVRGALVYALDARSGRLLWKYDPQVEGNGPAKSAAMSSIGESPCGKAGSMWRPSMAI